MEIAVIFDMDGVIVDNGKYHILAYKELCSRHDLQFNEEDFRKRHFGRVNEEILPDLFGRELSAKEISKLADEKESAYRDIYRPEICVMPGLTNFLKELKNQNIPVGVATSAPPENVEFVLEETGIAEFIDVVVDDTMITRGKPDPEIYLKAASLLKTNPRNCVVFEDSLSGTQAASEAGAKVVAVTTTLPAEDHRFAHTSISDFAKITVDDVRNLIAG